MNRVHTSSERPFVAMTHVAVAIRFVTASQTHIGILHRDPQDDEVQLLHLAWHHALTNSRPGDGYLWVDPAIHPARLRQVATICRQVWRANDRAIPYGFSTPNDCFDEETGRFLLGPTRLGLTCASFVLAIFHRAGIPLIQYETWPANRDGDAEWQQEVVAALEHSTPAASRAHVEAVRGEIGAVRFRPEEVAGSATAAKPPLAFESAAGLAEQLLARMRGL